MSSEAAVGLVTAVAGGFLAAHVAAEVVYVAQQVPAATRVATFYYFWPAALAVAIAAFAFALPPRPPRSARGRWWQTSEFATGALLLSAGLAWWGGVLAAFALAALASPLLLVWVDVARDRGLVRYENRSFQFHVSRTTAYAAIRAGTEALVVHLGFPARLADLAPILVATLETVGMAVRGARGHYTFSARSVVFACYAVLKSAVLVAVPLAERALLEARPGVMTQI